MPGEKEKMNAVMRPPRPDRVKFEVWGEEIVEKAVRSSGNSGRVYLPTNWVGHYVKIIRIE